MFARLRDKKYQVERARRQQQMENVRQEEHRGQEKNGMNASVNSTVYVCWQRSQVFVAYIYRAFRSRCGC